MLVIYYLSLPLHLPPQHHNDHYPQLPLVPPGLANKPGTGYTLGFANKTEIGPSGLPSISEHADLQVWINVDSSGRPGFHSDASALGELNIV